jgi:1-acyl-sn-glycerol-3-phosphate acyltransferase
MKAPDIAGRLRATGTYATDPARRRRLLGWSDAYFYARLFGVFARGNRRARRGRYDLAAWQGSSFAILRLTEDCGGRIAISGMADVLRHQGAVVYVGNHMSILETLLLPGCLIVHGPLSFVVKESLLDYPVFGGILRACATIKVGRQNPRDDLKEVLTRGTELLGQGRSVVIFPQATRSVRFQPADFNTLGVKLAARAGVPVVPVAVKTDFIGVGKHLRDFGRLDRGKAIHIRFAAPLAVDGNGREAHARTIAFIGACLREWGGQVADPSLPPEARNPTPDAPRSTDP